MRPGQRKPGFGETNLGAVVGAGVGSVGGLFAAGIIPAILYKDITVLFRTPIISLIAWVFSIAGGWFIGGQIGPRLGMSFKSQRAEIIGGALGGLIPIAAVMVWSWYISRR